MGSTASNVQYIMLADDDADDRLLFEEALGELDIKVGFCMVKDGAELIQYLTGTGLMLPQILFLDLNMPFKNGFQCLDEIRSIKTFQDLFIIIYSTTARAGDIDAGYSKGANLFMQKPNSYTELKMLLRTILTSQNLAFHPSKDQFVFRIS